MQPTRDRLISAMLQALKGLEAELPASPAIGHLRLALTELGLREDIGFMGDQVRQGSDLVRQGAVLAARNGALVPVIDAIPSVPSGDDPASLVSSRDLLCRALADLVTALVPCEDADAAVKPWLEAVVDWENRLYASRLGAQPAEGDAGDGEAHLFSAETIAHYLSERFPERKPVRVDNVTRLAGGFSKTTVLFDAHFADGGSDALVLRADPLRQGLLFLEASRVENEFPVLRLVHGRGLPVADPLWLEADLSRLGRRFIVSRKVAGRNIGSRIDVDAPFTDALLGDFVTRLVEIHDTPLSLDDPNVAGSHLASLVRLGSIRRVVEAQVEAWRRGIAQFALPPSPLRNRVLEWLARNIPDCDEAPSLLHGDYGLHNIMVEDGRISCILDWEAVNVGDPADELAWLTDGLSAQVEPARLIGLYEEISGRRIGAERQRYFAVFNALRFMATCPRALDLFQADPAAGIGALDLGLRFTFYGSGQVNQRIAAAEALLRRTVNQ